MKIVALVLILASYSLPAYAMKNETADELYTDLKRMVDIAEGHAPDPDVKADMGMVATMNYVEGLFDGIYLARLTAGADVSCARDGVTNLVLARTFITYLDANPGNRTMTGTFAAMNAFVRAYPCLRPKSK